jgi:hypothetical protein
MSDAASSGDDTGDATVHANSAAKTYCHMYMVAAVDPPLVLSHSAVGSLSQRCSPLCAAPLCRVVAAVLTALLGPKRAECYLMLSQSR